MVTPQTPSPGSAAHFEEMLNLYVDGDLPFPEQAALFAHLAENESSRRTLDALLAFRRMSRQEQLTVPPAADDVFFARLAQQKAQSGRIDRAAQRRPLWQLRGTVSLRAAIMTTLLVFMVGMLTPTRASETFTVIPVEYEEEVMDDADYNRRIAEAIYIFYPGIEVEADKSESLSLQESL